MPAFAGRTLVGTYVAYVGYVKDVLSVIAYVRKAAITSVDRPSVVLPGQLVPNTEQSDAPGWQDG